MDFKDQIKLLSERVIKLKENTQTEEATKTAFIMPFLQTLGYDKKNMIIQSLQKAQPVYLPKPHHEDFLLP